MLEPTKEINAIEMDKAVEWKQKVTVIINGEYYNYVPLTEEEMKLQIAEIKFKEIYADFYNHDEQFRNLIRKDVEQYENKYRHCSEFMELLGKFQRVHGDVLLSDREISTFVTMYENGLV